MKINKNKITDYLKVLLYTLIYYIAFTIFEFSYFSYFSYFKDLDEDFIPFSYLFASIILLIIVVYYYKKKCTGVQLINSERKYFILLLLITPIFNRLNFYFWKFLLNVELPIKTIKFVWLEELSLIFSTICVVPILEELFFRGIILDKLLTKSKSNTVPVIITSLLFCSVHLVGFNIIEINALAITFTFSILVSVLYIKLKNIYYPIFFHLIYNLTWYIFRFYNNTI